MSAKARKLTNDVEIYFTAKAELSVSWPYAGPLVFTNLIAFTTGPIGILNPEESGLLSLAAGYEKALQLSMAFGSVEAVIRALGKNAAVAAR